MAALPADYTPLEYIESDGTTGPYIETGHVPTSHTKVSIDMQYVGSNQNADWIPVWGYRNNYNVDQFALFIKRDAKQMALNYKTTDVKTATFSAALTDRIIVRNDNARLYMTRAGQAEELVISALDQTFTAGSGWTITLIGYRTRTNAIENRQLKIKIFGFTIHEGDTLVRDYIPVQRLSDGTAGLYDCVNGTFAGNAGSGTIASGPALTPGLEIVGAPADIGETSPAYGLHPDLAANEEVAVSAPAAWTNAAGTVAAACTGWKLYDVTHALIDQGSERAFTYVHPAADARRKLVWQWARDFRTEAVAPAGEGTAAVSAPWTAEGATATFTAAPAAGFAFVGWMKGATLVSRDNPYTPAISTPTTLRAVFAETSSPGWLYDTSAKTLTEQGVADGDTAWVLNCTVSGQNLTLASVKTVGTATDLNLRTAITATDNGAYAITAVGVNAFNGRTDLTSVQLPDTLTTIGPAAFRACTTLTNVVLSSSLTTFGQRTDGGQSGAFQNCTALRTVTPFLPDTLTYLGWATFAGCTSLEGDLRLGCGGGAFTMATYGATSSHFDSTKITSVTMGDGVTFIGSRDFYHCTALTNVVLSPYLTKIDQRTDGAESGAFHGCTALRTVTPFLPDTLTYLGWGTFAECTSLEGDLRLGCGGAPFTMAAYGQRDSTFQATRITSVTMGDGVTQLGPRTFYGCPALTNVVLSPFLTTFAQRTDGSDSGTFKNCTALRTVTPLLPDSVTFVGWRTFSGCTSLKGDLRLGCGTNALTLASYNSNGSHFSATSLDSVTLGTNAVTIPQNVFSGCTSLTGIVVEAESPSLANNAFANATAVREVVFKGFPTWTSSTFSGWTNYQSRFTVPGISASWLAFIADATKMTPWSQIDGTDAADAYYAGFGADAPQPRGYTVANPAKQWIVTTELDAQSHILQIVGSPGEYGEPAPAYGEYDFTEEVAQGGVTCAAPEYSVVGDELMTCTGYTLSVYDEETMAWGDSQSGAGTNFLFRPATSGTRQLKWTFAMAGYRMNIAKPDAITVTSDTPFLNTDGFYAAGARVTLTASSQSGVFSRWFGDVPAGMESNASVTITMDAPKALTPYYEQGWTYDSASKTITDGYWTLKVTVSGTELTVTGVAVRGILPILDLAKPVNGGAYTVVATGPAAFRGDTLLEELVLPETFREFKQRTDGGQSGAFEGCSALRRVTPFLPDSVTYLGWATFADCTSLEGDLRLGCGNGAFTMATYGARSSHFQETKITSVTMGDGVTFIGSRDFYHCTALTNVVLSPYLTKIDQRTDGAESGAFHGCTALRTVTPFLPDTLTYLGWGTFAECTSLEGDLRLGCGGAPFTMAAYGQRDSTFQATRITSVTMGDGVTQLGPRTFYGCPALTNVVLSPFLTTFAQRTDGSDSGTFKNCTALRTVTPLLPDTLTYLGWGTFANCTNLEGDLRLGCGTNALTLASYNSNGSHFAKTAIESATLGVSLATIPNNTFNNCLGMHDVYFCAFPTVASAAFSSLGNYQTRFFVPRDSVDWAEYLADATKVRPWADLADDVRDEYSGRFGGRRPVGLGCVAPYKNQWFARWSPLDKRTMIILR